MLEVEMKFPVADFVSLERSLYELGAHDQPAIQQADHYFNAPDRDFAQTDEALRLRRIGERNYVTYKGPKRDKLTKTRTEIEVALAEGDAAATGFSQILEHLGYKAVLTVRKRRRVFHLEHQAFHVEFCLDMVEGLGAYAELEIVAEEARLEEAKGVLVRLAADLGLTASERRSYLELLLTRLAERPKC
jgi:adenylate cyclase class 2